MQKSCEPTLGESCVMSLTALFYKYASKDGDASTMTKKEVDEMLKCEFPAFYEESKESDVISALDQDKDGKMSMAEFMILISALSCVCKQLIDTLSQSK
ncbi:protein S100-G-like [Echeneis naucrates]|uniref:protein S100-G-like n=1 Tax=Echeneis naucrates TaxID=173247 RepID=UPI001114107F|nr:protein S100-G-like [Echeneis naucrates]